MKIPAFVLRKLYVRGSLARREGGGARFALRNTLATATLTGLKSMTVDGQPVPPSEVRVRVGGREVAADGVAPGEGVVFERNAEAIVELARAPRGPRAKVRVEAASAEFGDLVIDFEDDLA